MKEWVKSYWKKIFIVFTIAVITPIIIGLVLNIPTGYLTIGDENSWVSFYGSYTGGIIGGIVALIIASSQLINERQKSKLSQRSFLSAATIVEDFSKSESIGRKKKNRIMLTEAYTRLTGTEYETTYYSIIRHGGPDVIVNCEFTIIVGNSSSFERTDTIKVWIDFFEKEEEILIPLCSIRLDKKRQRNPFVKEIQAVYETFAGEKMKFYQSELERKRGHYVVGDKETAILNHDIQYTAFTQKGE
ncbi:TPA: hypothetical protein ACJHMI_001342 [Bacillus cereus]